MNNSQNIGLVDIITYVIVLFVAVVLSIVTYAGTFYIHEKGHVIYGTLDNLYNGNTSKYVITNWIEMPLLSFIKAPQQTRMVEGNPRLIFALGGSIFLIIVVLMISYIFYRKYNNRTYLLFIPLFVYHEFIGNFLCGTDNSNSSPHEICTSISYYWIIPFVIFFVVLMILILHPTIKKWVLVIKNKFFN